jgi:hypothetical protein
LPAPGEFRVQVADHLPETGHPRGQLRVARIAAHIARQLVNRCREAINGVPRVRTHRRIIADSGRACSLFHGLPPAFSHARSLARHELLTVIKGPFDIWGKRRPTGYPHPFSTGNFVLPVDFPVENRRPKRDRLFLVHSRWIPFLQVRLPAVGGAARLSTP